MSEVFGTVSYFMEICRKTWREVSLHQKWGMGIGWKGGMETAFATVYGTAS